jgi:hypothetical protein
MPPANPPSENHVRYWILELPTSDPNRRDVHQLDCVEAPGALVLFTSEEIALRFRDGGLTPDWMVTPLSRDEATAYLADMHELGAEHVAFDPAPGRENEALRIYEGICRLT